MCGENPCKAIQLAVAVCIAILVQACNLPAIERLSVDPNRPHVILAGDKAIFLAGYYEAPDDAEPKFPSMDYFLDRNAQYGCNTFRLPFGQENKSGPNNPYCPYSAWNNNDCGRPNEAYYDDFLRPFCMHARDRGIYVAICLYRPDRDWRCDNKTDANRKKTYDRITPDGMLQVIQIFLLLTFNSAVTPYGYQRYFLWRIWHLRNGLMVSPPTGIGL